MKLEHPGTLQNAPAPSVLDVIGDLPRLRSYIGAKWTSGHTWSELISSIINQTIPQLEDAKLASKLADAVHQLDESMPTLVKHKGIISRVAADLGYSRQNIYLRLKANQALQEVYDAIKDHIAEEIEDCIVIVALDTSHPSWFRAARYYSRVKMGWYESDRPSTASLRQPVIVNFIPVSRDDGDLYESS